jgi:hypothetical protein
LSTVLRSNIIVIRTARLSISARTWTAAPSFRSAAVPFCEENLLRCKLSLICIHPFGRFIKGQRVTDKVEVKRLMKDRGHCFVQVRTIVKAPPELSKLAIAAESQRAAI